jgi:paraquat-inducible protein A
MAKEMHLTCRLCGQEHRPIRLAPGEKAYCTRCNTMMAKESRSGSAAPLVFSLTGLILAVPALLLPLISAGKFGDERVSLLFTGVAYLWENGMRLLACLVLLCGAVLPVALLATVAILHAPDRIRWHISNMRFLSHAARIMERWAFPEVQVLAVLVALMKMGSVVEVSIGPGFWCYCGMALSLVLAQRSFDYDPYIPLASPSAARIAAPT